MSHHHTKPNLDRFEQAVVERNHEQACIELLSILQSIDNHSGGLQDIEFNTPPQIAMLEQDKTVYFCTRAAIAVGIFFSDPDLDISDAGARHFFSFQRWLATIFASSPYVNADHILQLYNQNPIADSTEVHLEADKKVLIKFCLLYFPESNLTVNLEAIWQADPALCASLCFALQSSHFVGTEAAFSKRHTILQWFPEKLIQMPNLTEIPQNLVQNAYKYCSYDIAPNKHNVKKALNQVIRRHLLELGYRDREIMKIGYRNNKPVMVILLEDFHNNSETFSTYSIGLAAARQFFYLVGFGDKSTDHIGQNIFDEFYSIPQTSPIETVSFIRQICETHYASVFYIPSIGKTPFTVFAANLRYAPLQITSLGYPSSSCSEFIDYMLIEEDYIGSENCFTEKLLRLPSNSLPHVSNTLNKVQSLKWSESPEIVNIGITADLMQLNPFFLDTLRTIRDRTKVKIRFHFGILQCAQITIPYLERVIKTYLGDSAQIYFYSSNNGYEEALYRCDMMLIPFPFSNGKGVIHMVERGLVGICKRGREVHQYIDEALFKRFGLPQWLVVNTLEEYIGHAVLLAENHQDRLAWRQHIIQNNKLNSLYEGNPDLMGQIISEKLMQWVSTNNVTKDYLN